MQTDKYVFSVSVQSFISRKDPYDDNCDQTCHLTTVCRYEAVGLLILPMKRMLPVEFSTMKTKKGLSILTGVGVVSRIHSEMVMAAASVPISVTLIVALWDACGKK